MHRAPLAVLAAVSTIAVGGLASSCGDDPSDVPVTTIEPEAGSTPGTMAEDGGSEDVPQTTENVPGDTRPVDSLLAPGTAGSLPPEEGTAP